MKKAFVTMFAALLTATTSAEVIDGFSYNLYKWSTGNYAKLKKDYNVSYSGDIVIPPTVTYNGETYTVTGIESRAMNDISMVTSLTIPATITSIETSYNFNSKEMLERITVAPGNPYYDSREGCNAIIETLTSTLILGSSKTVVPAGVTQIGVHAFKSLQGLTSITLPEGVTVISDGAFSGCTNLVSITLPESIEELGESVFSGCSNLKSIVLPKSVNDIDENCFSHCASLTSMTCYSETMVSIDSEAFGDSYDWREISHPMTLYVPKALVDSYKAEQGWTKYFTTIEAIPEGTATKGDANGDGKVDILDVTTTISYILGQQVQLFNKQTADVNADGVVDIVDVTSIIDIILKAK